MLTTRQKRIKYITDVLISAVGLLLLSWLIILLCIISFIDTKKSGIISQYRVGLNGTLFKIYKIRTMRISSEENYSTITIKNDKRVTKIGRVLRRYKVDELPQLLNVIIGNMSIVGPRPDVPGFADKLNGDDRIILTVKPGITGPATLYFKDEETLLVKQEDPEAYNRDIIWPTKVKINKEYINNYHIFSDFKYIIKTILVR